MTAISLVPPPMSMIMFPDGPLIGHVGADRGGERLLDQVGLLGAGLERRVADGALLDAGHAGRDADHHLRPVEPDPAACVALPMKKRSIASVMT